MEGEEVVEREGMRRGGGLEVVVEEVKMAAQEVGEREDGEERRAVDEEQRKVVRLVLEDDGVLLSCHGGSL